MSGTSVNGIKMGRGFLNQTSGTELPSINQNASHDSPFRPRPVQILRFEDGGDGKKLVLEKEKLAQIFGLKKDQDQNQSLNSRLMAVLCIAGHTGGGKSFFLRHFIYYLHKMEKELQKNNTKEDSMGFPVRSNGLDVDFESSSFTFGDGDADRTIGAWMWSQPFTIKNAQGRPVDIYLMDTQGVFDEMTGQREWSIIVGLSLLMSSTLIFNFTHDINESHLEFFSSFLNYGIQAKTVSATGTDADGQPTQRQKPFQKLVFLVRDWNKPAQFRYGSKGGKLFIQKKLQVKSTHSPVQQEIRRKLIQSFEHPIQCHLFPHPGKKALYSNFDGDLKHLDAEFQDCLLECLSQLVPSSSSTSDFSTGFGSGSGAETREFPVNRVNGFPVTALDYIHLVEYYVEKFNSNSLPEPKSLYELHLKIFNSAIVRQAHDSYVDKMYQVLNTKPFVFEEELLALHCETDQDVKNSMKENLKDKVVDYEDEQGEDRERDLICLQEVRLVSKISKSFHKISLQNSVKLEDKLRVALSTALPVYQKEMETELDSVEFFDDHDFQVVSGNRIGQAIRIYVSHFDLENSWYPQIKSALLEVDREKKISEDQINPEFPEGTPLRLKPELQKFIFQISRIEDGFRMFNTLKKNNAEHEMSSLVLSVVSKYKTLMAEQLEGNYISDVRLQPIHDSIMEKLLEEFQQIQSSSRFFADAPADIMNRCTAALESQKRAIANQNEEILSTLIQTVQSIVDTQYVTHMQAFSGNTDEAFEELHRELLANSVKELNEMESVQNNEDLKTILKETMYKEIKMARFLALEQLKQRQVSTVINGCTIAGGAAVGTGILLVVMKIIAGSAAVAGAVAVGPITAMVVAGVTIGGILGGACGWLINKARADKNKTDDENYSLLN